MARFTLKHVLFVSIIVCFALAVLRRPIGWIFGNYFFDLHVFSLPFGHLFWLAGFDYQYVAPEVKMHSHQATFIFACILSLWLHLAMICGVSTAYSYLKHWIFVGAAQPSFAKQFRDRFRHEPKYIPGFTFLGIMLSVFVFIISLFLSRPLAR